MLKCIENLEMINYNIVILDVNNFEVSESDNPYGHVREFNRLDKDTKKNAYRVISMIALELYGKGKIYGSAIDVSANTYDFEIFSDATYRVIEVKKYNENVREAMYGRNIEKDS